MIRAIRGSVYRVDRFYRTLRPVHRCESDRWAASTAFGPPHKLHSTTGKSRKLRISARSFLYLAGQPPLQGNNVYCGKKKGDGPLKDRPRCLIELLAINSSCGLSDRRRQDDRLAGLWPV